MNMSYCRFSNTLSDLQDCIDYLEEHNYNLEFLSADERHKAEMMLDLIQDVASFAMTYNCRTIRS